MVPQHVHGDLPYPRPERSFPPPLEPGDIADHDKENLLGEVGGFITEPRDTSEPAADERPVDLLQPQPIGVVRSRCPEPIEKADGSRVHGRSSMKVQPTSPLNVGGSYFRQNLKRLQRGSFLLDDLRLTPSEKSTSNALPSTITMLEATRSSHGHPGR